MKISLITAAYNSGTTFRDTIRSVLSQTYGDIEYIIVDGLSTDNTPEIIREYEPLFAGRMRWVSEKDNGLYDAMNKGIRMATGDVVGILNSDDFFTSPDVLERVFEAFRDEPTLDAVYGDIHFVNPDNLDSCVRYYSSRVFRPWLMRLGFMPAHPSFYVRREVYVRYGLYKTHYKVCADYEWMLRTVFVGGIHIRYLGMDMVTMRMGGVSTHGVAVHRLIAREHLQAHKENKVYTNSLLQSLRYFWKIWEMLSPGGRIPKVKNEYRTI